LTVILSTEYDPEDTQALHDLASETRERSRQSVNCFCGAPLRAVSNTAGEPLQSREVQLKRRSAMTYVASPSFSENSSDRRENLEQCLATAKHRLDEVSNASETEREAELIASAIDAGWGDEEVRSALANRRDTDSEAGEQNNTPRPVVPSSSM
jgi:hypothetical protein